MYLILNLNSKWHICTYLYTCAFLSHYSATQCIWKLWQYLWWMEIFSSNKAFLGHKCTQEEIVGEWRWLKQEFWSTTSGCSQKFLTSESQHHWFLGFLSFHFWENWISSVFGGVNNARRSHNRGVFALWVTPCCLSARDKQQTILKQLLVDKELKSCIQH